MRNVAGVVLQIFRPEKFPRRRGGGDFGDAETVRLCGVEAALISEEPRGNFDGGALAALSFCVGAGG
jgi:hypothetical protein